MDRQAGPFVHDQQSIIFIQNGFFNVFLKSRRPVKGRSEGQSERWNPDLITHIEASTRLDAALVDAHFALAQQAIDQGARHPFEFPQQEIVNPLARIFWTDAQHSYRRVMDLSAAHDPSKKQLFGASRFYCYILTLVRKFWRLVLDGSLENIGYG